MATTLPVVKSKMKQTDFMVGSMTWAAVDRYVVAPDDKHWDPIFGGSEEAQRKLNKPRVKNALVPYLTDSDDAFFSTLTLVMVPLDGSKCEEGRDYEVVQTNGDAFGELHIEDHVLLFPADGQHRRAGIGGAIEANPELARESVPVLLVPYKDKAQVRQLFSDLNLNAKPVSKSIGYAFERRNPVVVLTKRVIRDVGLFGNERVNMTSNSLSKRSAHVITMNTLVASHRELLASIYDCAVGDLERHDDLKAIASRKPSDAAVGKLAQPLVDFWDVAITSTPGWSELLNGSTSAGALREGDGDEPGYVSAFGIGWQAIAITAAALYGAGFNEDPHKMLKRCLESVEWKKAQHWDGIAMVGSRINNTGPGVRATAGYLLHEGGVTSGSEAIESLVGQYQRSVSTA